MSAWRDLPFHPGNRTLRQFSSAWLVIFSLAGAHQYVVRHHYRIGFALIFAALVFGLAGLIAPQLNRRLFIFSMVLAWPIGWIVSQIALALMFYALVTPLAFFLRLRGRDLLSLKPRGATGTFWIPKQASPDVKSYFRQY